LLCFAILPALLPIQEMSAQETSGAQLARILERLDALEQQNRDLLSEVRTLREQVAKTNPLPPPSETPPSEVPPSPVEERLAVAEQRITDLSQSKLESEHRGPVQLTGMLLFNSFLNGAYAADRQDPVIASLTSGPRSGGASLRQTVLGLKFQAPEKIAGIDVSGAAYMDFFAGTGTSLNQLLRLRVASIDFTRGDSTFTVAQDKPIVAPREPDSLAQVGLSPLTASGNLWLWQPQVRFEQRFHFGETAGLRAQVGSYETSERGNAPAEYTSSIGASRPSLEGRFVLWANSGQPAPFEIAPGFHVSDSHVGGFVIPSRIFTLDWQAPLGRMFTFTGSFFHGQNVGVIGGLQQGVAEAGDNSLHTVHADGGWVQLKFQPTKRLTFNFYGGQEDDRNRDLTAGQISKNQTYAANAMYRIMSNVITGFEWSYLRTTYVGMGNRFNPHYDLAFAYLF
jgi:hypothetical protein